MVNDSSEKIFRVQGKVKSYGTERRGAREEVEILKVSHIFHQEGLFHQEANGRREIKWQAQEQDWLSMGAG